MTIEFCELRTTDTLMNRQEPKQVESFPHFQMNIGRGLYVDFVDCRCFGAEAHLLGPITGQLFSNNVHFLITYKIGL